MNTTPDARTLNLCSAFALLLSERMFAAMDGQGGVSRQEGLALMHIGAFSPGFAALQGPLRLTQSATSRLVDRLAAKKLVSKKTRPADPREKVLSLTRQGKETVAAMLAARQAALQELFHSLDAEEMATLQKLVSKLLAAGEVSQSEAVLACRLCDAQACAGAAICPARGAKPDQILDHSEPRRLPTHLL